VLLKSSQQDGGPREKTEKNIFLFKNLFHRFSIAKMPQQPSSRRLLRDGVMKRGPAGALTSSSTFGHTGSSGGDLGLHLTVWLLLLCVIIANSHAIGTTTNPSSRKTRAKRNDEHATDLGVEQKCRESQDTTPDSYSRDTYKSPFYVPKESERSQTGTNTPSEEKPQACAGSGRRKRHAHDDDDRRPPKKRRRDSAAEGDGAEDPGKENVPPPGDISQRPYGITRAGNNMAEPLSEQRSS
jgi:hypothetical protein